MSHIDPQLAADIQQMHLLAGIVLDFEPERILAAARHNDSIGWLLDPTAYMRIAPMQQVNVGICSALKTCQAEIRKALEKGGIDYDQLKAARGPSPIRDAAVEAQRAEKARQA